MTRIKRIRLCTTILVTGILVVACGSNSNEGIEHELDSLLIINEIVAKAGSGENDWVELLNIGNGPISTENYSLMDKDEKSETPLPIVILEPGDFLVIEAIGESKISDHYSVPFKLGSEDIVSLLYDGVVVNKIQWKDGDANKERSFGMYNGASQTLYPTPNGRNAPYELFLKDEVVTVKLNLSEENWQAIFENPEAEEYQSGSIEFNGILLDNVAIRTKGLTSLGSVAALPEDNPSSHRFSFKVDINAYEDQTFLGMKKLVFNNNWADPSMMRDVIAYELMEEAGVAAPRIAYVDLWVAGEHLGVYNIVEAIDGEFIEEYFPDDDSDTGDLYKAEFNVSLKWIDDSISSYGGLELKTNKETLGTEQEGVALVSFLDALNNSNVPESYLDVDSILKYFAANTLVANMDSYGGATGHNFYLYEQRSNYHKFSMLPWDFNLAMGSMSSDCDATKFFIDEPTSGSRSSRPLYEKLLSDSDYLAQYHNILQNLIDNSFSIESMNTKIDRIEKLIDTYVRADPTKFFSYQEWQTSLVSDIDISDIDVVVGALGIPSEFLPEGFDPSLCPDIDFTQGISDLDISVCFNEGYWPPVGGGLLPSKSASGFTFAPGLKSWIESKVLNVQQQLNGNLPSSNNGHGVCAVLESDIPDDVELPGNIDLSCLPDNFDPVQDMPPPECFKYL